MVLRKSATVGTLAPAALAVTAFSGPDAGVARRGALPWWGWLLIVLAIVLLAFLIWWCLSRRRARRAAEAARVEAAAPVAAAEPKLAEPPAAPQPVAPATVEPDDLKIIEGIGPKVASLLNAGGITTFAQLAAADVGRLREILVQANLRMMDPDSWPEQAAMAAEGKWEELTALQDALKGGRRA